LKFVLDFELIAIVVPAVLVVVVVVVIALVLDVAVRRELGDLLLYVSERPLRCRPFVKRARQREGRTFDSPLDLIPSVAKTLKGRVICLRVLGDDGARFSSDVASRVDVV
jgi:hypothetical protein